jgi:hypothetical protein
MPKHGIQLPRSREDRYNPRQSRCGPGIPVQRSNAAVQQDYRIIDAFMGQARQAGLRNDRRNVSKFFHGLQFAGMGAK